MSGRVVDRETKQPVRRFLVGWGFQLGRNLQLDRYRRIWAHATAFTTADGRFRVPAAQNNFDRAYVLRIEADGYEPAVSCAIRGNAGNVTIDFELTKGQNFDATVLTPERHPAASAKVEIETQSLLRIRTTNGELETGSAPWHVRETDMAGRVHFPPQEPNSYVVITHASGYAKYSPSPKSNHRIIMLDPWTRVEGTYRVGGKPLAGIPIGIDRDDAASSRRGDQRVFEWHDHTTTDPQGRFLFERVFAGLGLISRYAIWPASGGSAEISSTSAVEARFPLGETIHVNIEEKGRPVIGKLRVPAGFNQKVAWQSAVVELELQTNGDMPSSHFRAVVGADGSFRTDPLPGGVYSLDVRFLKAGPGHVWDHPVVLSTGDNDSHNTQPLDLGVLTLDKN